MENSKNTYDIRKKLVEYVEPIIVKGINQYIKRHKNDIRFFLHYPLIDIEKGLENEPAESISNDIRRGVVGYLIENTTQVRQKMVLKKRINEKAFQTYQDNDYNELCALENDYRTLYEIKDGNSFAKSIIKQINPNRYKLITSLVQDEFKEEAFYFYGMDNELQIEKERKFIEKGIDLFYGRYFFDKEYASKLKSLETDIDYDLLEYSRELIMKDLNKLPPKVKSPIFKSIDELANVLSVLYYFAFTNKMKKEMNLGILSKNTILNQYLMCFNRNWLVNKICTIYNMHLNKVSIIIDYFINNGNSHLLEFPLFAQQNYIITIPSLIMVNDWQFTIFNGHYYKNIQFIKRNKTISLSTQNKLRGILNGVKNVIYKEEKYYEILSISGDVENSDIDFAIYDLEQNIILIIEAKWKENHYYNANEKRYPKIEDTFNKIFKDQIEKHKRYLSNNENIMSLFDNDSRVNLQGEGLKIYYLAVDKRNQLHINNNHMITEYMLLSFIKSNIQNSKLDLKSVINIIDNLKTKVEYISIDGSIDIKIDSNVVEVDSADLQLHYQF